MSEVYKNIIIKSSNPIYFGIFFTILILISNFLSNKFLPYPYSLVGPIIAIFAPYLYDYANKKHDEIKIKDLITKKINSYFEFVKVFFKNIEIDKNKIIQDILEEEKELIDNLIKDQKESLFLKVAKKSGVSNLISDYRLLYYVYLIKKYRSDENPEIFIFIKEKLESGLLNNREFLELYVYYFWVNKINIDEQILDSAKEELEKEFINKYYQKISRLENDLKIKNEAIETLKIWVTKAEIPDKHLKKLIEAYKKYNTRYLLVFKIEKSKTEKLKNLLTKFSILRGSMRIPKVKINDETKDIPIGVYLIEPENYMIMTEKFTNKEFKHNYYGFLAIIPINVDGFKGVILPENGVLKGYSKIAKEVLSELFRGIRSDDIIYFLSEELILHTFPLNILCGDLSPPLTESERFYFVDNDSNIRNLLNIKRVVDLHKLDVETIFSVLKKNIGLPGYRENEFLIIFGKESDQISEADIENRFKNILKSMASQSKKISKILIY